MKKVSLILLLILTIAAISSFTNSDESEITITVTSDKKTAFDLFQVTDLSNSNGDGRTIRGLTTPYKLNVKSRNGRFIFKSTKLKSSLKIMVESNKNTDKALLQSDWPIIVLLINQGNVETFGID